MLIVFLPLSLLFAVSAGAATRYVWQDSPNPTPPYTNWASSATNIQDAVDAAVAQLVYGDSAPGLSCQT